MKGLFEHQMVDNQNTLVIIGNGFDLAHGIESSYYDFRKWLQSTKYNDLTYLMDIFFSNERDVWGNMEKALGEYNENAIIDYCKPNEKFDYDHPTTSMAEIQDAPDWIFKPAIDDFIDAFTEWVNSIEVLPCEKIFKLFDTHKYLTFNYTETLEKVYGIPESEVLHIHGSRLKHDTYVIGHGNFRNENEPFSDETEMPYVQETQQKIIGWMNGLIKDTTQYIKKYQSFFDSLVGVKKVIVYGLSLSKIDWPYLEEIISKIGRDIEWRISFYSQTDKDSIKLFTREKSLNNVSLFDIERTY